MVLLTYSGAFHFVNRSNQILQMLPLLNRLKKLHLLKCPKLRNWMQCKEWGPRAERIQLGV